MTRKSCPADAEKITMVDLYYWYGNDETKQNVKNYQFLLSSNFSPVYSIFYFDFPENLGIKAPFSQKTSTDALVFP